MRTKLNELNSGYWLSTGKKPPVEATMGVQSATQVVAMIDSRFPEAKNWTKWWRKRAHLIMEADMSLHKPEDIMASYPTTDNNLESFHAHFRHAMPRRHLPLYLGVSMTYHYAEKCKTDSKAMQEGTRKQNRERGGTPASSVANDFRLHSEG